jgi:hypothetical protein
MQSKNTKLLGGSPQALIRQEVEQRYNDLKKFAPITCYQIGLGLLSYPIQTQLKYSGLNYSIFTGFICYGNAFQVLKRVYGLYTYQQPLERNYKEFPKLIAMKMGLTIGYSVLFQTDLYPVLEQSMRWTWAFTTDSKPLQINGIISIPAPLFPIALSLMENTVVECIAGLFISLGTVYYLDLKRGEERVIDYAYRTYQYYYSLFVTLVS